MNGFEIATAVITLLSALGVIRYLQMIAERLGEMNSSMKTMLKDIDDHEGRIRILETGSIHVSIGSSPEAERPSS